MPQPIHLKDHEKDARLVRRRVIVGAVAVVLLTLVLVARMYHLQVTQYEYHSTLSENNRVHVQPIPPTRGIIFDRNGVIIADNRPSFSLTITRERTEDLQKTLDTLVEILGLTEDDRAIFEKRMKQGRRPFEPVPIMFELNEEQIARIAVNQFRLPGVDVATQFVRHYPLKEHFAHSVGYVGRINEQELKNLDPINYSGTHHIGKTGIERFYESELHGTVGYEEVETNARGRVLRVLKRTDPIPGKDIVLSIDSRLQEAAENALAGRRAPSWRSSRPPATCWRWSASRATTPTCSSPASASRPMPSCATPSTDRCTTASCAGSSAGLDGEAGGGTGRPRRRGGHADLAGLRPRLLPVAQLRPQVP